MILDKTDAHKIHEKTRTKPKNFFPMKFNLMGESLNECNLLLSFVPLRAFALRLNACLPRFVFFVDDILKGSL